MALAAFWRSSPPWTAMVEKPIGGGAGVGAWPSPARNSFVMASSSSVAIAFGVIRVFRFNPEAGDRQQKSRDETEGSVLTRLFWFKLSRRPEGDSRPDDGTLAVDW